MGSGIREYLEKLVNSAPRDLRKRHFGLERIYKLEHFDIGDSELTENLEAKLSFIADAKSFGVQRLGFAHSPNYRRYKESEPRTHHRLYVSPPTVLEDTLKNWVLVDDDEQHTELYEEPVTLYSSSRDLMGEMQFYQKEGYDVLHRTVHDFSDRYGCDITDAFLNSPLEEQACTLFHEDWHHTFHSLNPHMRMDREINEASAHIIGGLAAIAFLEHCYGTGSRPHKKAIKQMHRKMRYTHWVNETFEKLKRIYEMPISHKKKIRKKKRFLRWNLYSSNNAELWEARAYHKNSPLILNVYRNSSCLEHFMRTMQMCPPTEDAALVYLKTCV